MSTTPCTEPRLRGRRRHEGRGRPCVPQASALGVLLALQVVACRQAPPQPTAGSQTTTAPDAPSAAPLAPASESSEPAGDRTPLPLSEGTSLPSPYVEARRGVLTKSPYKEMLSDKQHLLRDQFGDEASRPLGIQEAQLENARRAVLISPLPDRPTPPLLLVLDERGSLLWTKPRPFAGTRPGIQHYAVTAAPRGGASMVWFDTASRVLALRLWDANGDILADFRLLEAEACDSLSAIYWPGVGHLVTIGKDGATQAQLLDANGGLVFGREGRVVSPKAWGRPGPVSLAIDTVALRGRRSTRVGSH